jgi:hypothetical protein
VLFRLESADFAEVFAETEEESSLLKTALDANQAQKMKLDALIEDYYGANPDGLTREQFSRAKAAAEVELQMTERNVVKHTGKRSFVNIPIGQTIREAYDLHANDLDWVRQLIGLVVDKIIVHPGGRRPLYMGKWRYNMTQTEIIYQV